ncbi:MAG: S8/S53 family peptidase [Nocardioides sp.]|nr:S8/S53 family peptidase [Nocardioides sp.]
MSSRPARALLLALLAAVLILPAPARAADRVCDRGVPDSPTEGDDPDPADDPVAGVLQLEQAHTLSRGDGVGIAVVDSGVDTSAGYAGMEEHVVRGQKELQDGHGTIVAGLAAGSRGVAPGAHIVSVRVTDSAETTDEEGKTSTETSMEAQNVTAAIRWLVDSGMDKFGVRVINLSLGFERRDAGLEAAINDALDAGMVVVVAAGNRTEDRVRRRPIPPSEVLFPARMDRVIATTALNADLSMTRDAMLVGEEIDVSAPIWGAQSRMITGLDCEIGDAGSSWAAPEVSGLAALILEQDPTLTPAQVKTRIEVTASGAYHDIASDGHGMIQPYEALTADLEIKKDGTLVEARPPETPPYEATEPRARHDDFEDSRQTMLWWGIGAGGALLAALMLGPLLGRRTR